MQVSNGKDMSDYKLLEKHWQSFSEIRKTSLEIKVSDNDLLSCFKLLKGIKLFTRLKLNFSHLNDDKF